MRLVKLMTSLAAGVCVLAACSARAQITNHVTFSATTSTPGTNGPSHGTNTFFGPPKTAAHNTTQLLQEIGRAINIATGNTLSINAKLVLLTGGDHGEFGVVDGATFYPIDNIMNVQQPSINDTNFLGAKVKSGTQNGNTGLAFPKLKNVQLLEVHYDDTSIVNGTNGTGLIFTIQGVASSTTTDTVPDTNGVYTETFSGKISNMTGDGMDQNGQFVVTTATLSVNGTGKLSTVP